jgi:hypothetical protein
LWLWRGIYPSTISFFLYSVVLVIRTGIISLVKSVGYVYFPLLSVLSRIFLNGVCGIDAALESVATTAVRANEERMMLAKQHDTNDR